MNQTQVNSITCSYCNETFALKWQYQNHYKKKHQNEVKVNENTVISRSDDEKFICICGKSFELGKSLIRHYKNCVKVHKRELEDQDGTMHSQFNSLINRRFPCRNV